jgi:phosphoglycolate phosphatase
MGSPRQETTTKPLIVFDLDGTLIDSRLDLANSANEMLAGYGAAPLPVDEIAAMVGEGARVLVERVMDRAGIAGRFEEAFSRFLDVYHRRLLEHTRLYDGIGAAVRAAAAQGASLALLTNKPGAHTKRILDGLGVAALFTWAIGGDEAYPRKPDPASLQALMNRAGVTADRTLLVGDSMIDVETARRAGVRICVALYGFGGIRGNLALRDDDLRARDADELHLVLAQWLGARGS